MYQVCQASPNFTIAESNHGHSHGADLLAGSRHPQVIAAVLHRNRPAQAGEVAVGNYFLGCDMNAGESRAHSIKK